MPIFAPFFLAFLMTSNTTRHLARLMLVLLTNACLAQSPKLKIEAELGGLVSSGSNTPFWLRANQFGSVPRQGPGVVGQLRVWRDYAPSDVARPGRARPGAARPDSARRNAVRVGFGLNPVVNVGAINQVMLVEGYAKVGWRGVEIWGGRRREQIGLGDTLLSSGFYAGAGNALPVPKVQFQTIGYRTLPFTRKFVAINAGIGHGWFAANYIQGAFLHQKHLHLRLGKPTARTHFYTGVNHQAQWGGQADYLREPPSSAPDGRLPSSLRDFPYVLTATVPRDWYQQGYTAFDSYRIGNHLGSIDFGVSRQAKHGNWLLYHQHPFEDVSGLLFINVPDGLWGLRWARNGADTPANFRFQRLTVEYLQTTNQSGPTFYITGSKYQGADNYFNHGQYVQGWSFRGNGIGTPLIPTRFDVRPELQAQSGFYFPSNRVQSVYVGAQAQWRDRLTLMSRLSVGRYYGTFAEPFSEPVNQFSALLMGQLTLPRWRNMSLIGALAVDSGQLLNNSVGGYVGMRWSR